MYKARWHGLLVAVKALVNRDSNEEAAFRHEVAVLQTLRHPHVVSYLDYIVDDDGSVSTSRCSSRWAPFTPSGKPGHLLMACRDMFSLLPMQAFRIQ